MFSSLLSSHDRAEFARSLSIFVKSGIPLNEGLLLLSEEAPSHRSRRMLKNVLKAVETGTSLSKALGKYESAFGEIFVHIVQAGESSGTLQENLLFLSDLLEKGAELKGKIRAALLYPQIVLVATILLAGGLALFILPKLVPLFSGLGVALPLPTKILLYITLLLQTKWHIGIFGAVGIAVFFPLSRKIPQIRKFYHWIALRLPFFGSLIQEYELAIMTQVFYTFLKSGLGVRELLRGGGSAVQNRVYKSILEDIAKRVVTGVPLASAFSQAPRYFPREFVTLIAVGERSGTLENSFLTLSEKYQYEVDRKTKKLPVIIEPSLLIFIGLLVGFVAISILLPIYNITQGLKVD